MNILHTSDWHLGSSLYGRKRTEEHTKFLSWLLKLIEEEKIDLLMVAGDIFDNTTPSNSSQSLYYWFLKNIVSTCCQDVIITAGNHDSPSFLEAPQGILKAMNIHVVGHAAEPEKEIINILDQEGNCKLIVCAVPYLRERDIRQTQAGESIEAKSENIIKGITAHYQHVISLAEQQQSLCATKPPIFAMGHLFTAGGSCVEGDGVRELYIGNLSHVPATIFPKSIDYLALGHLHSPQLVNRSPARRYCGSPLPMNFAGSEKQKQVLIISTDIDNPITVKPVEIPRFQRLVRIQGDLPAIMQQLEQLHRDDTPAWLEIIYEGIDLVANLQNILHSAVEGSRLDILRIINNKILQTVLHTASQVHLEDISVTEVFSRCLASHNIPAEQEPELTRRFQHILSELQELDSNAT